MITDDDVFELFEHSDPARVQAETPRLDAIRYLDALRLRSADIASDRRQLTTDITP